MTTEAKFTICHHIKTDGIRCGSPALRGKRYCFYHYNRTRLRIPKELPPLDNPQALQAELAEVLDGLRSGALDPERGHLLLLGLHLAIRNLAHCTETNAE